MEKISNYSLMLNYRLVTLIKNQNALFNLNTYHDCLQGTLTPGVGLTGVKSIVLGGSPSDDFTNNFDGKVDEIQLWHTALSSENLKLYSQMPLSGLEIDGLSGYWPMNEGFGFFLANEAKTYPGKASSLANHAQIKIIEPSLDPIWCFSGASIDSILSVSQNADLLLQLNGSAVLPSGSRMKVKISTLPTVGSLQLLKNSITKDNQSQQIFEKVMPSSTFFPIDQSLYYIPDKATAINSLFPTSFSKWLTIFISVSINTNVE